VIAGVVSYMLLCLGGGGLRDWLVILGILYKTLLARKLSKPEDGCYRPKHVVFPLLINHHLAIYL